MITFITVAVTVVVVGFITRKLIEMYVGNTALDNDYKRWSEDELFVAAYIAVYVEDEVRLNNAFETLLAKALQRSERAVNEKIRRLSTIGAPKSDASAKDYDVVLAIAEMDEVLAANQFEAALLLIGVSGRKTRAITKYL